MDSCKGCMWYLPGEDRPLNDGELSQGDKAELDRLRGLELKLAMDWYLVPRWLLMELRYSAGAVAKGHVDDLVRGKREGDDE